MRLKKTFTKLSCNKKGKSNADITIIKTKLQQEKMHAKTFCKTRKNSKRELFINKNKNNTEEKAFEKHDKKRQKRKIVCKGA